MTGELIRQEAIKLFSQRFPWFLTGLVLLLQAASMLVTALRPPESSLDVLTGAQLWADGAGLGLRLLVFLVLVLGAMSFSREFSLGTAKTMLVLPITRIQWAIAKVWCLFLIAAGLVLLVALLGAVIAAITLGWGAVVREGVMLYPADQVAGQTFLAVVLTVLLILPLCAVSLLIGLYFSSSGAAVGMAVILGVVLEAGVNLMDSIARYVFFHHLSRPFTLIGRLGRGMPLQWEPVLTWGLGTALVSFFVFIAWLMLRLEYMDIRG
jgi:ABC-type transport system involved in multi-copper enzyme maturation permease subunit